MSSGRSSTQTLTMPDDSRGRTLGSAPAGAAPFSNNPSHNLPVAANHEACTASHLLPSDTTSNGDQGQAPSATNSSSRSFSGNVIGSSNPFSLVELGARHYGDSPNFTNNRTAPNNASINLSIGSDQYEGEPTAEYLKHVLELDKQRQERDLKAIDSDAFKTFIGKQGKGNDESGA